MKLLRAPQVKALTGLSRMTIYRLEQRGEFPSRVRLSRNSVAWRDQDVENWIASRPAVALETNCKVRNLGNFTA